MIYVTGDTHRDTDIHKLSNNTWKEQKDLTSDDYLIVCGDFGLPFSARDIIEGSNEYNDYNYWIQWLAKKPYTILWVDGNHENFDFWDKQEITEWHGGKVQIHPHASNIIRLMRGETYEIDNKIILAFGGAISIDKRYRVEHLSWWEQEQATAEDYENAINNLEKHNFKVDCIISHTIPQKFIKEVDGVKFELADDTAMYLEMIYAKTEFKRWYAGHFHVDTVLEKANIELLYNSVKKIDI